MEPRRKGGDNVIGYLLVAIISFVAGVNVTFLRAYTRGYDHAEEFTFNILDGFADDEIAYIVRNRAEEFRKKKDGKHES